MAKAEHTAELSRRKQELENALASGETVQARAIFDDLLQQPDLQSDSASEFARVMAQAGLRLGQLVVLPHYFSRLLLQAQSELERAVILHELGNVQVRLGQYEEADTHLQQALRLKRTTFADRPDIEIAVTLNSLGTLNFARGKHDVARTDLEEALKIWGGVLGEGADMRQAGTHVALGNIAVDHGQYSQAEKHFSEALRIWQLVAPDQPDSAVLAAWLGRGNAAAYQAHFSQAWQHYTAALQVAEAIFPGTAHPVKGNLLNNLGNVSVAQGDFLKAAQYYEEGLAMKAALYGTDVHPSILSTLTNLGTLYRTIGRHPAAQECGERGVQMAATLYGDAPHLDTVASYSLLGGVKEDTGEYLAARSFFQQGLEMLERFPGEGARYEAGILHNNLGSVLLQLHEPQEAILHFDAAMRAFALDGEHPEIAAALRGRSEAQRRLAKLPEALADAQAALVQLEKFFPQSPHVDKLEVYDSLGAVQVELGNSTEAVHTVLGFLRDHLLLLPSLAALASPHEQYRLSRQAEKQFARLFAALQHRPDLKAERQEAAQAWLNYKGSALAFDTSFRLLAEAHPELHDQLEAWQAARRHLARLHSSRADEFGEETDRLQAIQRAEHALVEAQQQLRHESPRLFELQSVTLSALQSVLTPDETYVDFAVVEEQVYAVTVTADPDEGGLVHCGATSTLYPAIDGLRSQLTATSDEGKGQPLGLDEFRRASGLAAELYEQLIRPIREHTRKADLILSPDGHLHFLPFDVLYDVREQAFLVEQGHLRLIPFGRDLIRQRRQMQGAPPTTHSSPLLLGYPDFDAPPQQRSELLEMDALQLVRQRLAPGEVLIQWQRLTLSGEERLTGTALWRTGLGLQALTASLHLKAAQRAAEAGLNGLSSAVFPDTDLLGWETFTSIISPELLEQLSLASMTPAHFRHFASLQDWWEHSTPSPSDPQPGNAPNDRPVPEPAGLYGAALPWAQLMSVTPATAGHQDSELRLSVEALPATFTQVVKIAGLLDAFAPRTFMGAAASLETLRASLERASQPMVLHLTTHGTHIPGREDDPQDAAYRSLKSAVLLLAGANNVGEGQLTAFELGTLNLQGTALVNLAACDTALGEAPLWEGVQGFVSAAFLAGARATLTTLWAVESRSTERFMADFYRAWVRAGIMRPDRVCTQLKRQRIQAGMMPFYWAGFVVHGQ